MSIITMNDLFNLDDIDDIEVDAELLERANPIFNTAKMPPIDKASFLLC